MLVSGNCLEEKHGEILTVGYLVCLDMVLWLLVLYSLNSLIHFVVQNLTVDNFYSNAHIYHMCNRGQRVVGPVEMGFHTFVFSVADWILV